MKLYVCWGTFRPDRGHPCGEAHEALVTAGYQPEEVKTGGCYRTDPLFPGRREVKRLTGNYKVPTLVLDDGTIIDEARERIDSGWEEVAYQSPDFGGDKLKVARADAVLAALKR